MRSYIMGCAVATALLVPWCDKGREASGLSRPSIIKDGSRMRHVGCRATAQRGLLRGLLTSGFKTTSVVLNALEMWPLEERRGRETRPSMLRG